MPSPESGRLNLEHARMQGRIIFWRSRSESQRVKAEIVWLYETQRDLSQRLIARMLRVSQPYVARVLKRLLHSGHDIERAIGAEAYEHLRALREARRREHFQAQGAPASLTREAVPFQHDADPPLLADLQSRPVSAQVAAAKAGNAETEYVELGRSTNGEVIELHGSKPPHTLTDDELQSRSPRPVYVPQVTLSARERAELLASGFVYDQCRSFGRR